MKVNRKVIVKLQVLQAVLDVIVNNLYKSIDINNINGFQKEYPYFVAIKKDWERVAKCGYKNPEIEHYAAVNNLVSN